MVDRLAQLKKFAPAHANDDDEDEQQDLEAQPTGKGGKGKAGFMQDYFKDVGNVKNSMNDIKNNVDQMKKLKDKAIHVTLPAQEKKISEELQRLIDETNALCTSVKTSLENMKRSNSEFERAHPSSSEARIRNNMHSTTTRKFKELLEEYGEIQSEFKSKVRQKVERQVKIVDPEASQEEVDEIISNGEAAQVFRQKIMDSGHERLKSAVADIQDKYRDIIKLERSVAELQKLFVDLALLVESQGELLDQIEFSVTQAKEFAEKGEKELIKAKTYAKRARKRACCLLVCIIVILIAVLLPIFSKQLGFF